MSRNKTGFWNGYLDMKKGGLGSQNPFLMEFGGVHFVPCSFKWVLATDMASKRAQSQKGFPTVFRWVKIPWWQPESICLLQELKGPSMKIYWKWSDFHGWVSKFPWKADRFRLPHGLFAQQNTVGILFWLWALLLVILEATTHLKLHDRKRTPQNSSRKGFWGP